LAPCYLEEVDLTLEWLCEFYWQAYGIRVGVSTMHFTLKRMGLSYKKDLPRPKKNKGRIYQYLP